MKFLKPFAARATASTRDLFTRTRIILTLQYVAVIGVIIAFFSLLLYISLTNNVHDTLMDRVADPAVRGAIYDAASDRLQQSIFLVDTICLIVAMFVSYLLAVKTLAPIRQALDDQKQFSADASHELRTPLAIMQTQSEILLRDTRAPVAEYRKVIESNLEEINRMKTLVSDLLMVARSQQDNQGEFSPIDFSELLATTVENVESIAAVKSITLSKEILPNLVVVGDQDQLMRAIRNILDNAITYTPDHGTITLSTKIHKSQIVIEISDSGIGIDPKDLPHIFKRFYKADHARMHTRGSTGLGLAIVDDIIRAHQGAITAKSTPGKGTTMIIRLPQA